MPRTSTQRRKKKVSFKKGSSSRAARDKMAEGLKDKYGKSGAYAIATSATKKMSPSGRKRMAKHGVGKRKVTKD